MCDAVSDGESAPVALADGEGEDDPDGVADSDTVGVGADVSEGVRDTVCVRDGVLETDTDRDNECDRVAEAVRETDGVAVAVALGDAEAVPVVVSVRDAVYVLLREREGDDETVPVAVADCVGAGDSVPVRDGDRELEKLAVGVAASDRVGVAELVADGVDAGVMVRESVADAVSVVGQTTTNSQPHVSIPPGICTKLPARKNFLNIMQMSLLAPAGPFVHTMCPATPPIAQVLSLAKSAFGTTVVNVMHCTYPTTLFRATKKLSQGLPAPMAAVLSSQDVLIHSAPGGNVTKLATEYCRSAHGKAPGPSPPKYFSVTRPVVDLGWKTSPYVALAVAETV